MSWLDAVLRRVRRWQGHVPLAEADLGPVGARLRERAGFVLGVNGGSHDAGVALVRVEDGVAELVLNAEEERFSRKKHDWGAPMGALAEALGTVERLGGSVDDVVVRACGWDFAAFVATWTREVAGGFPDSLGLLGAEGFMDAGVARRLPALVGEVFGPDRLLAVPHHAAHAWGSVLLSPFSEDDDVLVVVIDGMGDRGSLSVHRWRDRTLTELYDNGSVFDSLGLMYQWLSSTQGGWTPLASEGRFMGAAAWGSREDNAFYADLQPMLHRLPEGRLRLDRDWIRWDRDPKRPYGDPLRDVLGEPIPPERLWDPNAVLDPARQEVPELTQARLDKAAAVQRLFEDGVEHVIGHWLQATGARRVIWTGGTALNAVAALRLAERWPEVQWWTPPFPGDNGVAAGAALAVAWSSGAVERVRPLDHAFLGGGALTREAIDRALVGSGLRVAPIPASELGDRIAELLVRGAILGLAQGAAETGPRALGHRSILADPTREDALERINAHVKRREAVRPLAPMMLADEAERLFELPVGTRHHALHGWRFMVRCARARPGTRELLPAVVHVDGTSRIQVVDPEVDPVVAAILEGMRVRKGLAVAVNTSLNVGEPIAHTAEDVLATLRRARDLHGVVLVDEEGEGVLAWDEGGGAGRELGGWV